MNKRLTIESLISWGTYLLVFLLPWQTRWMHNVRTINSGFWEYGSFSLYATEILLWVVAALFIWRYRGRVNFNKTTIFVGVAFLAWLFVSTSWAVDGQLAINRWTWFVEAGVLALLVAAGPVRAVPLMISLVGGTVLQGLLGWSQFLSQSIWASTWLGIAAQSAGTLGTFVIETGGERWLRAYGGLPHPNIFGAWMLVGIGAVAWLATKAKTFYQRWFVTASALVLTGGLLMSFSRAAWLAAIVGGVAVVSWLVWRRYRPQRTVLVVALTIVLTTAAFVTIFHQPVFNRFDTSQRLEAQSITQRVDQYQQARQIIGQHWLTGVGLGNYTIALLVAQPGQDVWSYQPVHNSAVLLWAEAGILAVLLYGVCIIWPLWALRRRLWLVAPLLVLVTIGLFDHFLVSLYPGVLLTGLVYGLTGRLTQSS